MNDDERISRLVRRTLQNANRLAHDALASELPQDLAARRLLVEGIAAMIACCGSEETRRYTATLINRLDQSTQH